MSMPVRAARSLSRRADQSREKNNHGGNGHDNNDNAGNDNNRRTRIDRFKGVEAALGRESDWSFAMETSRRLMVDSPSHTICSEDGSIHPSG